MFLNQSPEIWAIFQKFPEIKKQKRGGGYDLCVYKFPQPSIASRGKGAEPLLYCTICGRAASPPPPPEANGKIRTQYTYFPSPKESKEKLLNRGRNIPEIGGQVGKVQ